MPMEGTFVTKSGTVAGTQSLPTPMPMSTNPDSHGEINGPPDYKDQVNGILPGYSGHIPRARDKYAGSATGSIAPGKGEDGYKVYGVGGHVAIGPQAGHVRPEDVLPPRFVEYIEKSAGCMPGYTGFRPESVHVKNVAAYGGIPHQVTGNAGEVGLNFSMQSDNSTAMHLEQGDRSYDWRRTPLDAPPPSFRDNVGGVLPGYAGHVPRARDKVGGSPLGHLPGTPVSPNGKVGIDMEAMMSGRFERTLPEDRYKTFAQMEPKDNYTSEARDWGKAGATKPQLYTGTDRGPATTDGLIPGYGGHKRGAKFSYGSTIYSNSIPQGNSHLDNWSGKNFASTGHGASSLANFEDDVGLNTSGDVAVSNHGSI